MVKDIIDIPVIEDLNNIPKGDMPGDKVQIDADKLEKAKHIFPKLWELLTPLLKNGKAVVSVYGGSGVGKSEVGSLLAYFLNANGIGTYIMSGDNYPHRIPSINDAERLRIYREYGIKGLVESQVYSEKLNNSILTLQAKDQDFDPSLCKEYPGLSVYQQKGRQGLSHYLSTDKEIDYHEVNRILKLFKQGAESIHLKRMGRESHNLWYDMIDMSSIQVLILEWTHGNNPNLNEVDIPIFLNSTPQETMEHRRSRNRDGNTDSPFTTMVLEIEQEKLRQQAPTAKIIVLKNGEMINFDEYSRRIL